MCANTKSDMTEHRIYGIKTLCVSLNISRKDDDEKSLEDIKEGLTIYSNSQKDKSQTHEQVKSSSLNHHNLICNPTDDLNTSHFKNKPIHPVEHRSYDFFQNEAKPNAINIENEVQRLIKNKDNEKFIKRKLFRNSKTCLQPEQRQRQTPNDQTVTKHLSLTNLEQFEQKSFDDNSFSIHSKLDKSVGYWNDVHNSIYEMYDYEDFCHQVQKNARFINQSMVESLDTLNTKTNKTCDNDSDYSGDFKFFPWSLSSSVNDCMQSSISSEFDESESSISLESRKYASTGCCKSNLLLKSSEKGHIRNDGSVQSDYVGKREKSMLFNHYVQNTFASKLAIGSDKLQILLSGIAIQDDQVCYICDNNKLYRSFQMVKLKCCGFVVHQICLKNIRQDFL